MSGRQEQILSLVEQLGFVRVDDLAARSACRP
jgi:DeoR/GlpR family transcriptional regulator of sugar metabolism